MLNLHATLANLAESDVVGRIWRRDYTVWKPSPEEITDRLGWLDVIDLMREQVPALESFAKEVKEAAFRHVVLLGMGGSSLGPEVLRQTFACAPGYPELTVLDSIIPTAVRAVTDDIEPTRTLFLLSSKSGSTIESNALYKHFRGQVDSAMGKRQAGSNFVAITDQGSSLEALAGEQGFRRLFLNPSDLGGRYSVLSYFGLVPAALMGLDLGAMLDGADVVCKACGPDVPVIDNPGAWLGAVMGEMALCGRNKLTIVASPSIGSFGLWAEQLIAESTGKEGKGIILVDSEPADSAGRSGDDRLFVYLRLEGDENASTDEEIAGLPSIGQPVVRLDLKNRYELGGEFFRWEFATAVAGSLLSLNPFDQPDVQRAKTQTDQVLQEYRKSGRLPRPESDSSFSELLSQARHGDYLAIMAFVRQTPEVDDRLGSICRRVLQEHGIATTLGYGPRFLHSTGQLHKGGPDTGIFLQLTADRTEDVPIPGEAYTFGVLADAQALGDLRALQELGRRVVRVQLGHEVEMELDALSRQAWNIEPSGKDFLGIR